MNEERIQSEPREREAAGREADGQGRRSDDTVPSDGEVREPESRKDERGALAVGERSQIRKHLHPPGGR